MLVCMATVLINLTSYPWNAHDNKVKERATFVCKTRYEKSPCLVKLIKRDKQDYRAICGIKKEKPKTKRRGL